MLQTACTLILTVTRLSCCINCAVIFFILCVATILFVMGTHLELEHLVLTCVFTLETLTETKHHCSHWHHVLHEHTFTTAK